MNIALLHLISVILCYGQFVFVSGKLLLNEREEGQGERNSEHQLPVLNLVEIYLLFHVTVQILLYGKSVLVSDRSVLLDERQEKTSVNRMLY